MAPGLFEEAAKNTKASDIYSYGMILWELGARQIPFFKKAPRNETVPFLLIKGMREDITPDVKDKFPTLAKLITQCWASRSEQRPMLDEAIQALEQEHKTVFKK